MEQRKLTAREAGAVVEDDNPKPATSGRVDRPAVHLNGALPGAVPRERLCVTATRLSGRQWLATLIRCDQASCQGARVSGWDEQRRIQPGEGLGEPANVGGDDRGAA